MSGPAPGPRAATAQELKAQIDAERSGRPFLAYRDRDGEQRLAVLDPDVRRLWVGRSGSADLRFEWDEEVSALHAQIEVVRDECTLVDDGLSRNGSFVNEERVSGRRLLRDQDVLRFGSSQVLYRAAASTGAESTVVAGELAGAATVSPAQRRVLIALCRPFKHQAQSATPATNPQIAADLHLSVAAVKTHLHALFRAFEIDDLPQQDKRRRLVALAFSTGLVSDRDL